jgi:hypothetical protein
MTLSTPVRSARTALPPPAVTTATPSPPRLTGSRGVMPQISDGRGLSGPQREGRIHRETDRQKQNNYYRTDSRRTNPLTLPRLAPSAMRAPISFLLRAIMYAITPYNPRIASEPARKPKAPASAGHQWSCISDSLNYVVSNVKSMPSPGRISATPVRHYGKTLRTVRRGALQRSRPVSRWRKKSTE